MKKYLAALFAAGMLLCLFACKKDVVDPPAPPVEQPEPPVAPPVEKPAPENVSHTDLTLMSGDNLPVLKINIRLPKESGTTALDQINVFYEDWLADTLYYGSETLFAEAKQAAASADFKPFSILSDFSIVRNDSKVYSVERTMEVFAGTALDSKALEETFSAENGGRLSIFDLWNSGADWQALLWKEMSVQTPSLAGTSPNFEQYPFDFSLTANGISVFRALSLPDQEEKSTLRYDVTYDKINPLLQEKWKLND